LEIKALATLSNRPTTSQVEAFKMRQQTEADKGGSG